MARVHGFDRRRHTRVKLPPSVVTPLFPQLKYNQISLPVIDVSIGGARIDDANENLTGEVGHLVRMDLCWPNEFETLDVRVIAASCATNRHLNFQNLSPGSLARLSMIVRHGSAGQKLRLVTAPKGGPVQLHSAELWTGINGDSLAFFDNSDKIALFTACATTIVFGADGPPRTLLNPSGSESRPAHSVELADALVVLVNIPRPTARLLSLIRQLTTQTHLWSKTGSGGA